MTAAERLAAIRAREQAAREPILPHLTFSQQSAIYRARSASLADVPRMADALDAVLALTYASDDGTEYEHNLMCEGEAECPKCWALGIRAAITDALGGES